MALDQRQPSDGSAVLAGEWDALPDTAEAEPARGRLFGRLGFGLVQRYGGHPVALRIGQRQYARRLFVGSRERMTRLPLVRRARPAVDVIVNLCDLPDHPAMAAPDDLWWPRGEGPLGYQPDELLRDAAIVAELLREGKTVLVHCVAGVNRAPTLATAVVMLLEGCSARAALHKVRQGRWMAFPDPWHWRTLRRLEARLSRPTETSALPIRPN